VAQLADGGLLAAHSLARRLSEKPLRLSARSRSASSASETGRLHLRLQRDQLLDLRQEPGVDAAELVDRLNAPAEAHRVGDIKDAVRAGLADLATQQVLGVRVVRRDHLVQPVAVRLQPAQGLLQGLLEGAADGHDLADGLHLRGEPGVGGGNFSNAKRGTLVTT
jgi:hypothetical protein